MFRTYTILKIAAFKIHKEIKKRRKVNTNFNFLPAKLSKVPFGCLVEVFAVHFLGYRRCHIRYSSP